jgi:hypothetical protein
MLNLHEKLFLITLSEEDSSVASLNYMAKFSHTLAGALFLDLVLKKSLHLGENHKVIVQDTENQLDNLSVQLFELATKPNWTLYAIKGKKNVLAETIKEWLSVGAKIPNLRHQIAIQLAEKNVLNLETSKWLGMKVSTRYILPNKEGKYLIIKQLNEIINGEKIAGLDEIMLLHLVRIGELEEYLLNNEQKKDKKFKQTFKEKIVKLIQNAYESSLIENEIKKIFSEEAHEKIMDAIDALNNVIDAIGDAFGDAGDGGGDGGDGGSD